MKAVVLDYNSGNVLVIHFDKSVPLEAEGDFIDERVRIILEEENIDIKDCHYMIVDTDEFGNFKAEQIYE
jgi:hypothetical protein